MKLTEVVKGAKTIGISGHIRPDGDCTGSTMALYLYLQKICKDAEVHLFLESRQEDMNDMKHLSEVDTAYAWEGCFDVFFALDCAKDRLGKAEAYFESAVKTVNIDHHVSNKAGCAQINYVEPEASSTSELIYELIKADENLLPFSERMDEDIAVAIYIGMIHDTGVFQYSNTTRRTLTDAAELLGYGFDFPRIIEESFYQRTYVQSQIMGRALLESIRFMGGRCITSCVSKRTMEFYGARPSDLDGIVNQLRNIKGVDCAIFLYETGPMEYKVSMRSNERVNVSQIAAFFGGGGHVRAAGCSMQGSFYDCVNNLAVHIEKQLIDSGVEVTWSTE